jgi:uncharacterized protein (TIGR02231 family)
MAVAGAALGRLEEEDTEEAAVEELASMVEAEEPEAEVTEGGAAVSFQVPGRTGIPDDGSPHKVTLGFHEFPARFDYVSAPKLVTQAYRRARAVNSSQALLLPGAASIFHQGEFVGGTRLKTVAPGQEFEVFLGVDDRVKVDRRLVEGSVDKKLLVDVRRLSYAYEIEVTNLKQRRETVTLIDQLPLPRHESVKVRRLETRPDPVKETDMGRLCWELSLEPGEKRSVRFGFSIEAPRDVELTGLPPLTGTA